VSAAQVPRLGAELEQAVAGLPQFELTAHGLGCFPNVSRPNVIWVGLEGELAPLLELAKRIEDASAGLGLPREERSFSPHLTLHHAGRARRGDEEREERSFSPHLTLGRIRREARPADRAELGATIEQFPRADYGVIHADAVHLIESALRPGGAVYTVLQTIQLGG
jgi:2'-5' RNA ligase